MATTPEEELSPPCLEDVANCLHETLMAHMEQSEALSHKGKPIAFLFKVTKASEITR
jgi:hypothetical protein